MTFKQTLYLSFYKTRSLIALGYLLIGAGTVILLLRDDINHYFFREFLDTSRLYALPLGLGLLGYGAAIFMLLYLRGSLSTNGNRQIFEERNDSVSSTQANQLNERIIKIDAEVNNLKSAQLGALSGNREELIEALKPTIHAGLADELSKRFTEQAENASRDLEIRNAFSAAQRRLQLELASLSRRSNLNLVIGVITTAIAVGLLTYMVLGSTLNFESLTSIVAHYLPRLTLVIFIEVFSFFFLRLYRATLAEMRTYQTDLTALTVQFVAVQSALSARTPESALSLSKELLSVKPTSESASKETKSADFDAKAVSELLQSAAKALLPKSK